jgi:hypothetical protein
MLTRIAPTRKHLHDSLLLADQVQSLGRFLGEAHNPLRTAKIHAHSIVRQLVGAGNTPENNQRHPAGSPADLSGRISGSW